MYIGYVAMCTKHYSDKHYSDVDRFLKQIKNVNRIYIHTVLDKILGGENFGKFSFVH